MCALAGVLAPGLSSLLSACGPAAQATPATKGPLMMGYDDNPFWKDQAARFTKATGIEFNYETIPFMQIHDKYLTSFMSGGGEYDLAAVREDNIAEWAPNGWIEPLDTRITQAMRGEHFAAAFDYLTLDGKIYGVPRYVWLWQFYYNMDLFEKAGLSAPPSTWDELREAAIKLTKPPEYGFIGTFGNQFSAISVYTIRLRAEGGELLKDGKPAFNNEAGLAALQWFVDAKADGSVDPSSFETGSEDTTLSIFLQGRAGMIFGTPPTMALASDATKSTIVGKVGVALAPGSKVPSATVSELAGIGITATAADKDAAWEYAKFVTSADEEKQAVLSTGVIPTQVSVLDDAEVRQKNPAIAAAAEQMKYPMGMAIVSPKQAELNTVIGNEIIAALQGTKVPEQALTDAESAALRVIGA
jgi:multiple sugar transport system substrate-binding protein